jgi:polysaccharide pyruvyl transferase WcaK-like protein
MDKKITEKISMIYLVGGSGVPNFGDELMAASWLRYLNSQHPDKRIVMEVKNPSISSLMLGGLHPRASHVSIIKKIAATKPLPTFWENVNRGYRFMHRKGFQHHAIFDGVEKILNKAEVIHLFGGGYINENWPHTGFLLGFAAALQDEAGCKLYGTGLGLMPMSDPPAEFSRTFRRIIDRFEFIESRDAEGYAKISRLQTREGTVINGLDDTFMNSSGRLKAAEGRTMHISCFLDDNNLAIFIEAIQRLRRRSDWEFNKVLFWECAPHRDRKALEALREILPEIENVSLWNLIEDIPVHPGDAMITTRFHPHLLAARAGAMGYYIHSGDYYRTKHESVVALGSPFLPFSEAETRGFSYDNESSPIQVLDKQRVERKLATIASIYDNVRVRSLTAEIEKM